MTYNELINQLFTELPDSVDYVHTVSTGLPAMTMAHTIFKQIIAPTVPKFINNIDSTITKVTRKMVFEEDDLDPNLVNAIDFTLNVNYDQTLEDALAMLKYKGYDVVIESYENHEITFQVGVTVHK